MGVDVSGMFENTCIVGRIKGINVTLSTSKGLEIGA